MLSLFTEYVVPYAVAFLAWLSLFTPLILPFVSLAFFLRVKRLKVPQGRRFLWALLVFQGIGAVVSCYGFGRAAYDCTTGPPDGLCMLGGILVAAPGTFLWIVGNLIGFYCLRRASLPG
jgi:hypothetical protein